MWPFKKTHILERFPLFHYICLVAWGVIILKNKIVRISTKMCLRYRKVTGDVYLSIFVKVILVKKPVPLYATLHTRQLHPHRYFLLYMQLFL